MKQEIKGEEVNMITFEEDNESSVNIYWKDGTKTKCCIIEEL